MQIYTTELGNCIRSCIKITTIDLKTFKTVIKVNYKILSHFKVSLTLSEPI